jgi:predicted DsbA family dithiol-disulfide isomerase
MQMKARMEEEGLAYDAARNMTYNSRLAQELAKWAESKGIDGKIHDPLFRAYFVDMKNIGQLEILVELAAQAGLPADEAKEVLARRSFKDQVDADWRRCADLGVSAVPTFVSGRYMMVGAHPYEHLEQLILKASGQE